MPDPEQIPAPSPANAEQSEGQPTIPIVASQTSNPFLRVHSGLISAGTRMGEAGNALVNAQIEKDTLEIQLLRADIKTQSAQIADILNDKGRLAEQVAVFRDREEREKGASFLKNFALIIGSALFTESYDIFKHEPLAYGIAMALAGLLLVILALTVGWWKGNYDRR